MRIQLHVFLTVLILFSSVVVGAAVGAKPDVAPVISFRYVAPMTTPSDSEGEKAMQVFADGKYVINTMHGPQRHLEGQFEGEEVKDLLHFVIDKHRFYKFDANRLRALPAAADDMAATEIRVRHEGRDQRYRVEALQAAATFWPKDEALGALYAIERKLKWLMSVETAGGVDAVRDAACIASAAIREQYPAAPDVDHTDLELAHFLVDGGVRLRFLKNIAVEADGKRQYVFAELDRSGSGVITITTKAVLQ